MPRRTDTLFLPSDPTTRFQKRAAKHGDTCEVCKPTSIRGKRKPMSPAVATLCGFRVCATCWQAVYVMENARKPVAAVSEGRRRG